MAWSNTHDPVTWHLPYLVEQCTPGVSWSYSHAFADGSRYYSPSYRSINMVCRVPPPQRIVYPDTSLTTCASGQELLHFYYAPNGDTPESRASTWCGAAEQALVMADRTDPYPWRRPFLLEHCNPGVSWSYSHGFPDGSRYYSPPFRGINLVCQGPPPPP